MWKLLQLEANTLKGSLIYSFGKHEERASV